MDLKTFTNLPFYIKLACVLFSLFALGYLVIIAKEILSITVLGVIIGGMIWGIPGIFLSVPVIAVLKIIFDRLDSLKPWGIILGDEEKKQNKLATRFKSKPKLKAVISE